MLEALGFPANFAPADAADDLAVANFIDDMPDSFLDTSRAKMSSIQAWAHALFAVSTPATPDIGKFSLRGLSFLDVAGAMRKLAPLLAQGEWASDLVEYCGQVGSQNRVAVFFLFRVIVIDTLLAVNVGAAKPSPRGPDAPVGDMSFADVACAAARKAAPEVFRLQNDEPTPEVSDSGSESDGRKEAKERKRKRRDRKKRERERKRKRADDSDGYSSVSDESDESEGDEPGTAHVGSVPGQSQASIALLHQLGVTNHTTIDGISAASALQQAMESTFNVDDITRVVGVIVKVAQRHDIDIDGDMGIEPLMAKAIRGIKKTCGGNISEDSVDNALATILRTIVAECAKKKKKKGQKKPAKRPKAVKALKRAAQQALASLSSLAKDATRQSNLARLRGRSSGGFMQTTDREQALIDQIKRETGGHIKSRHESKKRGGDRKEQSYSGIAGEWHQLLLKKKSTLGKTEAWAETDKILGGKRICLGCKKQMAQRGPCGCDSKSIHADWMAALARHQF